MLKVKGLSWLWLFLAMLLGFYVVFPKDYVIERSVIIDAKPEEIYPWLVDLRKWGEWGIWFRPDSTTVVSYSGPDRAIGMQLSFDSKKNGTGSITIEALHFNQSVMYTVMLISRGQQSVGEFRLIEVARGTKLTWTDTGSLGYNPVTALLLWQMQQDRSKGFEIGLQNLKTKIENTQ
jgi:hypothetical protein